MLRAPKHNIDDAAERPQNEFRHVVEREAVHRNAVDLPGACAKKASGGFGDFSGW